MTTSKGVCFALQAPAVKTMAAGAALFDSSRDSNAVGSRTGGTRTARGDSRILIEHPRTLGQARLGLTDQTVSREPGHLLIVLLDNRRARRGISADASGLQPRLAPVRSGCQVSLTRKRSLVRTQ